MRTAGLGCAGRTVTKLRPAQAVQRVRLRAQRATLDRGVPLAGRWLLAGPGTAAAAGWPGGFTPLDARLWRDGRTAAGLRAGRLSLLGVSRTVAPPGDDGCARWASADWQLAGAPLLWRFHLYYWDWAWVLAAEPSDHGSRAVFDAIWRSWRSAVIPGRGAAWHPYPAALRAWSFCGIYRSLVHGGRAEMPFLAELAAHAGFLRRNLETDVGGNHLIKNLKALAGLAVFFADDALLTWALGRLTRQLSVQVLPDGGHYERAPAYHCQVLGDLIDLARLLRAAGREAPCELAPAIEAMRGWLGAVLTPAGDVPLLNDGFPVDPDLLALLAAGPAPGGSLHLLPDTGVARIAVGGWHLLADVGPPCPRELPAHAHADTLSCVVHLDGRPLLIDTGTSTYEPGTRRDHERSTAAHNTVEVDGQNSTEVWGAFRAGRRARVTGVRATSDDAAGAVVVEAAHDGYRSLPGQPAHCRRWTVRADELRVDDEVTGRGLHQVTVRWYLAPGTRLRLVPGGAMVGGAMVGGAAVSGAADELAVAVTATNRPVLITGTSQVSCGFGRTVAVPVLACTLQAELPVRVSTVWRRAAPRQEPL